MVFHRNTLQICLPDIVPSLQQFLFDEIHFCIILALLFPAVIWDVMVWQFSLNNQNILLTPTQRDLNINLDFSIEKNETKEFSDNQTEEESEANDLRSEI